MWIYAILIEGLHSGRCAWSVQQVKSEARMLMLGFPEK